MDDPIIARSALKHGLSEADILDAIRGARDAGMSWAAIGNMVETSGEAARQRYQPLVA